jgi:hypothetical protein
LFSLCSLPTQLAVRPAHVLQHTAANGIRTICLLACLLACLCGMCSKPLSLGCSCCSVLRPQALPGVLLFVWGFPKQSWGNTPRLLQLSCCSYLAHSGLALCTCSLCCWRCPTYKLLLAVLRPASDTLQGATAIGAHTARHAVSCTLETKASLS